MPFGGTAVLFGPLKHALRKRPSEQVVTEPGVNRAALKLVIFAVLLLLVCLLVARTNDEDWLTVLFPVLFFIVIPAFLLSVRDVLLTWLKPWLGPRQLLLHVCAVLAAVVGYFVGEMAVQSGHERADLHRWMVLVFPMAVYLMPVVMALNGVPLSRIKAFYIRPTRIDDEDIS